MPEKEEKPAQEEQVTPEIPAEGAPPSEETKGEPVKVDDPVVGATPKSDFAWKQMREEKKALIQANEELQTNIDTQKQEHDQVLARYGLGEDQVQPGSEPQSVDPKSVQSMIDSSMQKRKVSDAQEDAYNYMLSQDDVSSKDHVAEIQEVMKTHSLDYLAERDPYSAVELALGKWRESREAKGSSSEATKEELAGGVPSGPASNGAGKTKLSAESIAAMSDEEFKKRKDELWEAA